MTGRHLCRRRSFGRRAAMARFRDHRHVPLSVGFDAGALPRVTFGEEAFDVGAGLEPFGRRPAIDALAGGGSQPGAQRHALGSRLMREPNEIIVQNQQLHSGHSSARIACMLLNDEHLVSRRHQRHADAPPDHGKRALPGTIVGRLEARSSDRHGVARNGRERGGAGTERPGNCR